MSDPRNKITARRCGECGASTTSDEYCYPSGVHKRGYACERVVYHDSGAEHDIYKCNWSPAGHKRIRDALLLDLRAAINLSDADPLTKEQLLAALTNAT